VGALEVLEGELDPGDSLGRVEQEDAEQLVAVAGVEAAHRIALSCAAATASARRETPSLS
jgi:hypothetical protein